MDPVVRGYGLTRISLSRGKTRRHAMTRHRTTVIEMQADTPIDKREPQRRELIWKP